MKRNALLVNVAFPDAVDQEALARLLRSGRLRAAFDSPPDFETSGIPPGNFIYSIAQTAFNTVDANRRAGNQATEAMIEMLSGSGEPPIVNPDFTYGRS